MSDNGDDDHETLVDQVLAEYMRSRDHGTPVDREAILAKHPNIATALRGHFADEDALHEVIEGLSQPTGVLADALSSLPVSCPQVVIGDYELLDEVGRGGMGVVYRARQRSLGRIVAVKMVLSRFLTNAADISRFRREAEAAANLRHPRIVAVHEVGEHDGQPYFSMDYIEGHSLAELARKSPLSARKAAEYVQKVAEAVEHAHQHGTLHRDLKPANILIDREGEPHVTDFGLAKRVEGESDLTIRGNWLGSPSYMPPEQASGNPSRIGPTSDIYALGATLYDLLTGRPPFRGETVAMTLVQVQQSEPVAPRLLNANVPRDLEVICVKCLEKEPERRYPTAAALAADLNRYLKGEPIAARPIGRLQRLWRWSNRKPTVAALTAAVILSLLLGTVVSLALAWQAHSLAHRADTYARQQEALRLVSQSREALAEKNPQRSLFLAYDAAMTNLRHGEEPPQDVNKVLRAAFNARQEQTARRLLDVRAAPFRFDASKAQVSADNHWLVATCADGTLCRWDLTTDKPAEQNSVLRLGHNNTRLVLTGDSHWLVTSSFLECRLWSLSATDPLAAAGDLIQSDERYCSSEGVAVTVSPNNHWLIIPNCGCTRLCNLWLPEPWAETVVLRHGRVDSLVSADSRWLVTWVGREAWLYDLRATQPRLSEMKFKEEMQMGGLVAISPDSHFLFTQNMGGQMKMWDLTAERPLENAKDIARPSDWLGVSTMEFNATGKRLLAFGEGAVLVWDLSSGQKLLNEKFEGKPAMPLSIPTPSRPEGSDRPIIPPSTPRRRIPSPPNSGMLLPDSTPVSPRPGDMKTISPIPCSLGSNRVLAKISPDGRRVVVCRADRCLLYDLQATDQQSPIPMPSKKAAETVADTAVRSSQILRGVTADVDLVEFVAEGKALLTIGRKAAQLGTWEAKVLSWLRPYRVFPIEDCRLRSARIIAG